MKGKLLLDEQKRFNIKGAAAEKMRPVGARVLIKVEEVNTTTAGGLHLPETMKHQRPARGRIIACGPDCQQIKEGDYAAFMMYAGSYVEDADEQAAEESKGAVYRIVRESEVFGVWPNGTWKYVESE